MTVKKNFGTAPVFFTAIATILGAILFLRFGFAVGMLGFWGTLLAIFVGHLVTIPTALAISEIATNRRVEGGGEYFIISTVLRTEHRGHYWHCPVFIPGHIRCLLCHRLYRGFLTIL